jgi:eukaryotic-like serine/threonine-protein kinase
VADTRPDDDAAARAGADTLPAATPHDPAGSIGRYRVLGTIGRGGMGVVLRAHDPQLRREIAIKLVRPRRPDDAIAIEQQARLLREARAMAALSHPNVVPVFDVGEHGDGLFIAMQYVAGANMRAWLAAERPSWRRVLGVFRAAGRGLAAAHAAGMVHRDFKPANVLVGDDGRVRVVDFGLARTLEHGDTGELGEQDWSGAHDGLGSVTQAGVLVGTPLYMAPEQFAGAAADARADQFAFCVSFFEALYGVPPFEGADLRSQLAAKRAGRVAARAPGDGVPDPVPAALHAAILRGLAADPAARFAAMPELLRELRRIGEHPALPMQAHQRSRGTAITRVFVAGALLLAIVASVLALAMAAP